MAFLFEEVLLIALDPVKGTLSGTRAVVETAAAGGIVTELTLLGISLFDEKWRVKINNTEPLPNCVMESARIRLREKPLPLVKALLMLTSFDNRPIEFGVFSRFVDEEILSRNVHQTLGLFRTERFFLRNNEVREAIIAQLRVAGLDPGASDLHSVMLLGLISRAGLARLIFSTPEINQINADSERVYASILEGRKKDKLIESYFQILGAVGSAVQTYGGI